MSWFCVDGISVALLLQCTCCGMYLVIQEVGKYWIVFDFGYCSVCQILLGQIRLGKMRLRQIRLR